MGQQQAAKGANIDSERVGFGMRLQAARRAAPRRDGNRGYTQDEVADQFGVNKATVSAWETGRGAPDAFTLKALARLYEVSADALLWENSLSPAAMKIAAEYDHLPPSKQTMWHTLWLGFIAGAAPGGENLSMPPEESQRLAKQPTYADLLTKPRVTQKGSAKKTRPTGT